MLCGSGFLSSQAVSRFDHGDLSVCGTGHVRHAWPDQNLECPAIVQTVVYEAAAVSGGL
jgi:hypothetical protein